MCRHKELEPSRLLDRRQTWIMKDSELHILLITLINTAIHIDTFIWWRLYEKELVSKSSKIDQNSQAYYM